MIGDPDGAEIEFQAHLRGDGALVLRPIVVIMLVRDGMELPFPMLVDTGADDVVLPEFAALNFGLNLLDGQEVQRGMLQGTAIGYSFHGFQIGFAAHYHDQLFPASVTFSSRLNHVGYGLLGREPLLDHFWFRFGNDAGHVFRFGPLPR